MSNLVGAISLTNNTGVYLGEVNLNNVNLDPNQIAFSSDGINLEGLNIGQGLNKSILNDLETIGNPDIQLVANSIYVNDNVGETPVQTAIDSATQADVIYVSSGSYGESQVSFVNKYNMALIGPAIGTSTICELLKGINIDGTNESIRISNMTIKTSAEVPSSQIKPVGRSIFHNVVFKGTSSVPHIIEIGKQTTKYMTFNQVEFDQYCSIQISNELTAPIYFINCNFGGATINYGNTSPLLVIMNNCSGLISYPTALQATMVGLCVLTTGVSNTNTTTINGSTPGTSNVSVTAQANNRIVTGTATTDVLHANQNATWDGTQISLFNSNHLLIGRGNNASADNTNLGVGKNALQSISTGTNNTIIGSNSETIITQNKNTVVGSLNGTTMSGGTFDSNTIIGYNNNIGANTTTNAVVIGVNSKTGDKSIAIGSDITNGSGGNSVLIGNQAGKSQTGGTNIVIGSLAATSLTNSGNCIIGYFSEFITNPINSVVIGANASSKGGLGCIAIGSSASANGKIGASAGLALGYFSQTGTSYNNCAVIGNNIPNTTVTGDNQFWLGNATNNLYATTAVINPSDARDKLDIKDAELGLDFINKLKPRMWRANPRSAYMKQVETEEGMKWEPVENDGTKAGHRFHYGVVAQEMKQTMEEMGVDFVALKDTSVTGNGEGDLGVAYAEFFGVFIKAFQELTNKNKQLEERIKVLENN